MPVRELWASLLLVTLVLLLGLSTTFLMGTLVQGGTEVLEGTDEVDSQITLGFVGFFDRLGDPFDSAGEAFEGGVDRLETVGDTLEEFCVWV